MEPLIDIQGLSFGYGKTPLFDALSLQVRPGLCGLLGKNGAGKSSLLKILSGQLHAHGGLCRVLGMDPSQRRPSLLSLLYHLPEEIWLPDLRGDRYVALNGPFYPHFSNEAFQKALALFEIPGDKPLNALSYGQKKKFLIAFAVGTNCPLLLLDEPTNGLDIPSKSQFRQIAASLDLENQAVLISTHQIRDMETLIDPIIIVDQGKIALHKGLEDILGQYRIVRQETEPTPGEALYWEKGLGSYTVAKEGPSEEEAAIDLEFLFNFIIARGDKQ